LHQALWDYTHEIVQDNAAWAQNHLHILQWPISI
jgi:hypothetical protein